MLGYLLIAGFLVAFCMVANRLSNSIVTAPMIFLGFGVLTEKAGLLPEAGTEAALHVVAEVALIILLFLDAAQIDQSALFKRRVWPARMLAVGLPLAFGPRDTTRGAGTARLAARRHRAGCCYSGAHRRGALANPF